MEINIRNCKNIDSAHIQLETGKLNIKYAMNGTGKSTIAKSLKAFSQTTPDISELVPFRYRDKPVTDETRPHVSGHEELRNIAMFNEEYLQQFTFRPDELLANSFEVFIKTADYDQRMAQIEMLTKEIRETFKDSGEITQTVKDFDAFIDSFGKAKSGYSAAGALAKGIGVGNKLENIPPELKLYSDYLHSEKKVPWISWQIKGNDYLGISDHCPFCTSGIETKQDTIAKVKDNFDAKSIEHLMNVLTLLGNIEKYFSEEVKARVNELSKKSSPLTKEEFGYLVQVKEQVGILREKLFDLRSISFFALRDSAKVFDFLSNLKINLDFIQLLRSENTTALVKSVNDTLEIVVKKAGELQGEVNRQKASIERTVTRYNTEINEFLSNAGYRYNVTFEFEAEKYRLRLRHSEYEKALSKGDQFLSFGEKNAFALVLFMYETLSRNVDLVVLDDPISSFDRNKKFALIDMLFMRDVSFRNRTVLLLTHDFEPVIDMLYSLYKKFRHRITVSFLDVRNGVITEFPIAKSDIKSFTDICIENIGRHSEPIVQLIHLRRYYEIISNKGLPYELLSNLFHKRQTPYKNTEEGRSDLSASEIESATVEIRQRIPAFDYVTILEKISEQENIKSLYSTATSNYEKLQLFRIATAEAVGDNVLKKYINETFHIENDYVMQLNPCIFQTTPSYIVEKCDNEMAYLT